MEIVRPCIVLNIFSVTKQLTHAFSRALIAFVGHSRNDGLAFRGAP